MERWYLENICVCISSIRQFAFYDIQAVDLCSKAVIDGELFHVAGLLSCLMREQANNSHPGPKWIILDGDVDPMWIESLNTVMDDNKVPLYLFNGFLIDLPNIWYFYFNQMLNHDFISQKIESSVFSFF